MASSMALAKGNPSSILGHGPNPIVVLPVDALKQQEILIGPPESDGWDTDEKNEGHIGVACGKGKEC